MTTYGLGIDIGTTFTAAAVRIGDRVEVVRLGNRRPEIPSLVFIGANDEVLIGEAAERRGAAEPDRLARDIVRRIGESAPIVVGGAAYSAYALTARLLSEVLAVVQRQLDGGPSAVTVTHPAGWGSDKRATLDQAVRLAGLAQVTFLSAPEAVAIRYAAGESIQPGEALAVYDLGGTMFTATVLRRTATGFAVLGVPEELGVGGATFDQAVYDHVAAQAQPDADAAVRLRRDAVEAKEALSFDTEVTIPVGAAQVRLSRAEFETLIGPALAGTVDALHRAERSAGVEPAQLRAILLAGGSSRIPLVGQLLGTFGAPVVRDPHPEHAVALGAAVVSVPQATAAPVGAGAPAGAASVPAAEALTAPVATASPFKLDRRRLLIIVPSLAAVSAIGGGLVGYLTREKRPPGGGAVESPTAGIGFGARSSPDPSPPPSAGQTVPTDPMLIRLDASGAWPTSSRSLIYRTRPGSGQRTLLAGAGFDILPQWSHDRTRIAYTRRAGTGSGASWQVWTMNADGGDQVRVIDSVAPGTRVAWSPDDRRLAYMQLVGGRPQLFLATIGEPNAMQVTNSPDGKDDPAWSPRDANLIALWSDREGAHEIFVVRLDQLQQPWQRLTTGSPGAEDPSWSPDGTRIAYTRAGDIWLVNADGSGNRAVTSGRDVDMDPTWSPDGGWIAFTRGGSQNPAVHIVRPDGTGLRKVTVGNAREGHPGWS